MFYRCLGTALVGSGVLIYSINQNKVSMAPAPININTFMAEPITDVKELNANRNDMKTKMELMIMRIQVRFFFIVFFNYSFTIMYCYYIYA